MQLELVSRPLVLGAKKSIETVEVERNKQISQNPELSVNKYGRLYKRIISEQFNINKPH